MKSRRRFERGMLEEARNPMPTHRLHFPDLLFDQTARFRTWEQSLAKLFHEHGYRELSPSLVMKRMRDEAVQCIDGEQVVGLRWDFTEALADLLATRFDAPPGRVSYRGAVFRKPSHAWEPVERFEVGAEHVSLPEHAQAADRELVHLLLQVPTTVGLRGCSIQLGSAALLSEPLRIECIPHAVAQEVAMWLSRRAPHRVHEALHESSAREKLVRHAECLLRGDVLRSPYAQQIEQAYSALLDTEQVARAAIQGDGITLRVDTADASGFAFYTGPTLRLWAPHAAFELGAGGRYDGLYPSLGKTWSAAGFCIRLARLLELADAHPELFQS
jgi:ATP phosphoribosyltransferase regulatory subunit